ncbi:FAD-dependent oxidoreductase [Nocardia sp. BSTN01]|uniref:oxidoreductase n=1 Tax=Nocardia sp. BSTN01 TaxID=2783665 RepID=UPI001890A554|nr:FAD-dependent oxidoreductase [Nocardia sp. BSTN01]MBF4996947.1 FAD-dependent oxidoreductase [Nocardia sp. BSTN01]
MDTLSTPVQIGSLRLVNRLVATAHGSGAVAGGLALPGDDEYWRRCAAGGAAMVIAGGTVVSPESTTRIGNTTEAWRPEAVHGLRRRAAAIAQEGAIPVCQLVHLGRETLGAEIWGHPLAPSAIRSPREPVRPRMMTEADIDRVVDDFVVSARHAADAGFAAVELHAAHGYLLAQFLSAPTNHRADAGTISGRARILHRLHAALTDARPELALGVRVSIDGAEEAGMDIDGLCALLPLLEMFDYINVTVGVRTTYVRDMATDLPPLLTHGARLRAATTRPLLVSQAFRSRRDIESALDAGADLVGLARPFIADPQIAGKLLRGDDSAIRPCVSCNEDCRTFTPALLCSVNPELGPGGSGDRPAMPLRLGRRPGTGNRVAIVGAGPAGLEAALRLTPTHDVTLFEAGAHIGGQLRAAAHAPHRDGWARLLRFYQDNIGAATLRLEHTARPADLDGFDQIIIATGATEMSTAGACRATEAIVDRNRIRPGSRVVVADDGFGYWPAVGAIESALEAGAAEVTVLVPGPGFGTSLPMESRVQLRERLAGRPVTFIVEASPVETAPAPDSTSETLVTYRNNLSGKRTRLVCDLFVTVGERIARDWQPFAQELPHARIQVIGDATVPRRVAHAIAEGYAAAQAITSSRHPITAA